MNSASNKNFFVFIGFENNNRVYRVLASEKIAKILGYDVIASCSSADQADFLCGVMECYLLLCNNISHSIFTAINSRASDYIKNKNIN